MNQLLQKAIRIGLLMILLAPGAWAQQIVVSQVYGGGGNAGATLKNDFIELFNRGTTSVSINGWSVQYASATGSSWTPTSLTGTIAPGGYYLVRQAAGAGGTVDLPTPDDAGNIAMSGTAGKVALVSNATPLSGACPMGAGIVDFVGYGTTAGCFEGAGPTPAPSNTTAALRVANGCTDTNSNASDFASGAPNPRNSASPVNVCAPTGPTVNLSVNATAGSEAAATAITVTATASVAVTGDQTVNLAVSGTGINPSDYTLSSTVITILNGQTSGSVTFTVVNDADAEGTETATLTISSPSSGIALGSPVSGAITIADDDAPPARIHDIQGIVHTSPLVGQAVTSVPGIVTARASNGFYMQDPNPDADDRTSEGIFVFTGSNTAPAASILVGDGVQVSGTVAEFGSGTNLTVTQIGNPIINELSEAQTLPAALVLGAGGRAIPTSIIEDDNFTSFDPATDGIDFYESVEGMRVQINSPVAVSPTITSGGGRGEVWVLADNGANATGRTARGGIAVSAGDFNPERIQIDDNLLNPPADGFVTPVVNVGAQFNTITGVVNYVAGNYEVLATSLPTVAAPSPLTKEVTNLTGNTNQLTVSTFNVENLDPGDATFGAIAGRIVNNLRSPDILLLEEIQDNNGATNDGVVDASTTFTTLINTITTAGGPTYQFRQINPENNQDGGEPGGNIRVGFLFNPNRVTFVDRAGGTATSATTINNVGGQPQLSFSPGRVNPANPAFSGDGANSASRKPLAGEFLFNGQTVFVIGNHFSSKGGDDPLFGDVQPPVLSSEIQRNQQAAVVRDFVRSILSVNADANVIVAGDLNDFEFSNPLNTLKATPLTALIETLSPNERYTYNFEGNAQTLDHILVSNNLTGGRLDGYDVVHFNSEFSGQDSDHDPSVARFNLAPATTASFAITGVTPVSCQTVTATERRVIFTPQYSGLSGQPVSFSVVRELNPTTNAGPYTLRLYIDNPSITLKATQTGTAGETSFTYNWLAVCNGGTPPPAEGSFVITGVTPVNCQTVTATERRVTFTPQYSGLTGQPVSFSVVRELNPTTNAGPYTLRLYVDNPVITLKATQIGTAEEVSFIYNWLATCNGGSGRIGVNSSAESVLAVRVLGNPAQNGQVSVEVRGAAGQPLRVSLTDLRGQVIGLHQVEQADLVEQHTFAVGRQPVGVLLLRAITPTQVQTVKVIKAD